MIRNYICSARVKRDVIKYGKLKYIMIIIIKRYHCKRVIIMYTEYGGPRSIDSPKTWKFFGLLARNYISATDFGSCLYKDESLCGTHTKSWETIFLQNSCIRDINESIYQNVLGIKVNVIYYIQTKRAFHCYRVIFIYHNIL